MPLLYRGGEADALIDTAATAARPGSTVHRAEVVVLERVGHVIADQGDRIMAFFDQASR